MIYISKELPRKYIAPFAFIRHMVTYKGNKLTTQEILERMGWKNTQHKRKWMNDCIQDMLDKKLLKGYLIEQNRYFFHTKNVTYEPGTFYSCDFKDIEIIMRLNDKVNNVDLAGYYAALVSTINHNNGVGHASVSQLEQITGLSRRFIYKYNKILEDHELIYMVHSKNQGKPNYYGLYINRKKVLTVAVSNGMLLTRKEYDDIIGMR